MMTKIADKITTKPKIVPMPLMYLRAAERDEFTLGLFDVAKCNEYKALIPINKKVAQMKKGITPIE